MVAAATVASLAVLAATCGGVVIGTLLIAGGGAGPAAANRLVVVPARAVTDPNEQNKRPHGVPQDHGAKADGPQAPADQGKARPTSAAQVDGSWNGFARAAPYVEAVEPSSDSVPVYTPIVVRFSQPMARASVEQYFAIRPRLDGQLVWLDDDFTLRFQPIKLAYGQLYEVQVGGRSVRGVPLPVHTSWHFTAVAAPPIVLPPGPSAVRVPILMYHYLRVNPDFNDRLGFALSVTPSDFAAQMDWLERNGYHPITFDDLNRYLSGQRGLPARPVILTFDDGYADFYTTALPILRAHDFAAVAYVVSGFIGQSAYMTAGQIVDADRTGVEIGAHTVNHINLANQSPDGMRFQLTASKEALEHLLGHPVRSLCYPSGRFSPAVIAAAQAAGYRDATTTKYGSVRTLADRYTWGRLRVNGGESLDEFASAVLGAS